MVDVRLTTEENERISMVSLRYLADHPRFQWLHTESSGTFDSESPARSLEQQLSMLPVPVSYLNRSLFLDFVTKHISLVPSIYELAVEAIRTIPRIGSLRFFVDDEFTGSEDEPMLWLYASVPFGGEDARVAANRLVEQLIVKRFYHRGIYSLNLNLTSS